MATSEIISLTRRGIIAGLAAIMAFGLVLPAGATRVWAAESEDPAGFVQDFSAKAVAVLGDQSLSPDRKAQEVRRLLTEGFDVPRIARFVLGRYWAKTTAEQRAEYERLFEDYILVTYWRKLDSYSDEKIEVKNVRRKNDRIATVSTRMMRGEGEPILLDWRLLRVDGQWRIVDFVVEGMSMALSQRSEFAAVVRANGGQIDSLIQALREKTRHVETIAAAN